MKKNMVKVISIFLVVVFFACPVMAGGKQQKIIRLGRFHLQSAELRNGTFLDYVEGEYIDFCQFFSEKKMIARECSNGQSFHMNERIDDIVTTGIQNGVYEGSLVGFKVKKNCYVHNVSISIDVHANTFGNKYFDITAVINGKETTTNSNLLNNLADMFINKNYMDSMLSNGSIYIIIIGLIGIIISIIVAIRLSKVKNNALSDEDNEIEKTNRKKRQKKKE